jgi:hypothetical protein
MTFASFRDSLNNNAPPTGSNVYLSALWYDAKNDWDKAHELIQDVHDANASWVHAYLHRKEGDISNAGYWYSKASKIVPGYSLDKEWEEIVMALI